MRSNRLSWLCAVVLIVALHNVYCELNEDEIEKLFVTTFNEQAVEKAKHQKPGEQNYGPGGASYGPQRMPQLFNAFVHYSGSSVAVNNYAQTGVEVTRKIMDLDPNYQYQASYDQQPQQMEAQYRAPERFCPFKEPIKCDPNAPYRTFDGSCNNLHIPWWGQADTPYKRWLPPDYSDAQHLNEPRRSVNGYELPNPRDISCKLHTDIPYEVEPLVSHMVMQYGQFINHDATLFAVSKNYDGSNVDCSGCIETDVCRPIWLANYSDCSSCFNGMRKPCMEFVRSSASFPDIYCTLGQREQLNIQTDFIDGSLIYGHNDAEAEKLRDKSKGRGLLKAQKRYGKQYTKDLLPSDDAGDSDCLEFNKDQRCFMAGDIRANQNPSLMSMHTIWVREHNRIANILSELNPQWEEETIFQETRRIIIAFLQHITYDEWLPKILGFDIMYKYDLFSWDDGYFTGYDEKRDPRTANEWATAAQRFGHSAVRSQYSRVDHRYRPCGNMNLHSTFFRPHAIYDDTQGGMESIVRGLLKDPMMKIDEWVTSDITKHLFETYENGVPQYFDLIAINIHRGRDHGIPGYTQWRKWCGLTPIYTWDDLYSVMSIESANILRGIYRFVEDIDLYPAGLSEIKSPGALVGPTFGCMIATQFQDWKYGDRFWYENPTEPARFTESQLKELRKITLSRVLCDSLENTPHIQPDSFLTTKYKGNKLVRCEKIPAVDFSVWKAY